MTTIYHNPRCSKSRATMEILSNQGIDPDVVLYLENPPDPQTLTQLTEMLGCSISDIIRSGEDIFTELGLAEHNLSEQDLVQIVADNPKLLERPIVVNNGKAVVGRPPENVLSIL